MYSDSSDTDDDEDEIMDPDDIHNINNSTKLQRMLDLVDLWAEESPDDKVSPPIDRPECNHWTDWSCLFAFATCRSSSSRSGSSSSISSRSSSTEPVTGS